MNEITYPPVREALSHLDVLYSDEELRMAAERREQALVDTKDMLYQARYEGEQKGLQEGREKGRKEGLEEGATKVLAALLTHKFGTLTPGFQERLNHATSDQLQAWSLNILDADSLDDVFTD